MVQLNRHGGDRHELWKLVVIEFGLAIIADVLNRGITLTDGLLGDLFSNYTSMRIMRHATTLDLDQFEDSVFYDKLEIGTHSELLAKDGRYAELFRLQALGYQ